MIKYIMLLHIRFEYTKPHKHTIYILVELATAADLHWT